MADQDSEEDKRRRAERIRKQISELQKGSAPRAAPKSPRDFIQKRTHELEEQAEGDLEEQAEGDAHAQENGECDDPDPESTPIQVSAKEEGETKEPEK